LGVGLGQVGTDLGRLDHHGAAPGVGRGFHGLEMLGVGAVELAADDTDGEGEGEDAGEAHDALQNLAAVRRRVDIACNENGRRHYMRGNKQQSLRCNQGEVKHVPLPVPVKIAQYKP
jgi:hypothetical protein